MDLGILGIFGRVWGVNWVWAVELTAYHSLVSITVPILLVELLYPEREAESWLSEKWRKIVPALFLLDVIGGYFIFAQVSNFWPPIPQYIYFIIVTILLVLAAHRLPADWARRGRKTMTRPRTILLISTIAAVSCVIVFWILPNNLSGGASSILVFALGLTVIMLTLRKLTSYDWSEANSVHRVALAAGSLSPLILGAMFQEYAEQREF